MKRITIFLIFVFLLVIYTTAQTPPAKKSGKTKKAETFDPPREAPGGIPAAGSTFILQDGPPPPASKYPLDAWKEKTFAQDFFAIAFPTAPEVAVKVDQNRGNEVASKVYKVITMDGTYSVSVIALPAKTPETKESRQERLRAMLKQLEKGGPYQWLGGKEIEVAGQPGVEFRYKIPQIQEISWQRFIAGDTHMYRIIADTLVREPELKEPQLFMESFKLLPETAETQTPVPPPAPRPTTQRVSGGVLQSNATRKVQPPYPAEAVAARATGAVQVAITVSEEGRVIAAEAVSGHPLLRDAAIAAAKQWQFHPVELSGVPVKVQGILTFNFTLQ